MKNKSDELRAKIELIRDRLARRVEQLTIHEDQYKDEKEFESAVRCSLKWRSLEMVLRDIDNALL